MQDEMKRRKKRWIEAVEKRSFFGAAWLRQAEGLGLSWSGLSIFYRFACSKRLAPVSPTNLAPIG
jgi:hypothetical protein